MIKTQGFILHKLNYSESSIILKVLTSESGLVTLMAKGARGKKGQFGVLDHFNLIEFVFKPSSRSEIWQLRDCSVIKEYRQIKADIRKQLAGFTFLEIHLRHLHGPMDSLEFVLQMREHLDKLEGLTHELKSWLSAGILKFCQLTGIAPVFDQCIRCEKLLEFESVPFSLRSGGAFCPTCRYEGIGPWRILSRGEIDWLKKLSQNTSLPNIDSELECENLLIQYLYSHCSPNSALKSLDFYRRFVHGRNAKT